MLQAVHHVAIIVSDYEKSKAFYVDTLGLEVVRENYRADRGSYKLDVKLGDCELEIFSFPGSPQRLTRPEACGLRHLAFRVTDIHEPSQNWNAAASRWSQSAWTPIQGICTPFLWTDGLPLELKQCAAPGQN